MNSLLSFLGVLLFMVAFLALFAVFIGKRVARAIPPAPEWIEVDGERINYRSLGEGPPILFVHGLGGQRRNFDYLPLKEMAQHHQLLLIDRPGSGHSPRRDDRKAGIAAQGRLVAGFIRAMGFQQKPLLVGHSLGGAIALAVALQDPDCIAGVALIAPLTHFSRDVPGPFRALAIETPWLRRWFAWLFAAPAAIVQSRAALAALFGPDKDPRDFPLRGGGLLSLRPGAFYGASTDMCAVEQDLPRQQERYGDLRLPVHILYGEGDRILDWKAQGEALAHKVRHAQLKVIPGGHMIPVTRAADTAAWLEQVVVDVLGPGR
jgi:pimeloyl-ACP methyl ester carboxylesterase